MQFSPPTADLVPPVLPNRDPGNRLFRHFKSRAQGRSVLKINGTYQIIDTPTTDQIASASEVYLGGHVYTVGTATAAALTAAGFTVT